MIHISRKGKVIGKHTPADAAAKIAAGEILPTDYWWTKGRKDWVRISDSPPPKELAQQPPESADTTRSNGKCEADRPAGDVILGADDWRSPPEVKADDLKKASRAQREILMRYGITPPDDLRSEQASAWISKLPKYVVIAEDSHRAYTERDWRSRPPREAPSEYTRPATQAQKDYISCFGVQVPNDLTKAEASRWLDLLVSSNEAKDAKDDRETKLILAEELLRKRRALLYTNNSRNLTNEIAQDVLQKVYGNSPELFTLETREGELGEYVDFRNKNRVADALIERLAKDYPACVDGEKPTARVYTRRPERPSGVADAAYRRRPAPQTESSTIPFVMWPVVWLARVLGRIVALFRR